jgi:photoactive yellow protein
MPTVPSEATVRTPSFTDPDLHAWLDAATSEALDQLEFGVIGFDDKGVVNRYNTFESRAAGLSPERVQGNPLFTVVAPCMNNFMVAQRFEDAQATGSALDATVDYVLTLRMRPVKVRLRLLAAPGSPARYVIVERRV